MEKFENAMEIIGDYIWGPWTAALVLLIGLYLGIGTRFVHILKLPYIIKQTLGTLFKKETKQSGEGTITAFQAVSVALSSTVGTGNIVGVGTALALGGPGAVFWMWLTALFGAATKYSEVVLTIRYREKDEKGNYIGGPAWYVKNGLNLPKVAVVIAVSVGLFALAANMVQSNAAVEALNNSLSISPWIGSIILVILVAIVTIGGVRRIGKVTEKLIPIMSLIYILGGLVVILVNFKEVPSAISSIFVGAFSPSSLGGGAAGFAIIEAIRYGMARGVYSNEAGQGTAPMAHAPATTDHPARQGMWGIMEVFLDTLVICTITSLAILTTGVLGSDVSPANLAASAFGSVSPVMGLVVSISLFLFAYSTVLALSYYGETVSKLISGEKLSTFYRFFFLPFAIIGGTGGLAFVWDTLDVFIGIILIPNLIALVFLSPKIFTLTKEFFNGPSQNDSTGNEEIN